LIQIVFHIRPGRLRLVTVPDQVVDRGAEDIGKGNERFNVRLNIVVLVFINRLLAYAYLFS